MKTNYKHAKASDLSTHFLDKLLIIVFFCLFCNFTNLIASPSWKDNDKLSLNLDSRLLSDVLTEIESKSDCVILFQENVLDENQVISLNTTNLSLTETLDALFEDSDNYYIINGRQIVINKKQVETVSTKNQKVDDTISVEGTIVDKNNETVIGASILVKGVIASSSTGTLSDIDGNFSLRNIPKNSTLVISYIGYKTQEIKVLSNKHLKIVLLEDELVMDEVLVVGYGSQAKVNLTGSVASVSNAELAERPLTSVSSGLQGLVSGVTITSGQGRPGSDSGSIRIRGQGTLNNSSPYILIDGIESGSIDQVDPSDIESISVLKDAASAAIYGSKAANGVVLITTKRGKTGRPIVTYNGSVGFQSATGFVKRMNSADAAHFYNTALENSGKSPRFTEDEITKFKDGSEPYKYPNTKWNKLGYDGKGFLHQHSIGVTGGTENIKHMTSIGYLGQEGIMQNTDRKQFNVRSNIDIKLSDYFTVRTNLAYINNSYKDANNSYVGGGSDQIIRQLNRIAPWIVYQYEDGTYGTIGDGNPIAWLDSGQTIDRKNQNFSGTVALDYNILEGLKLTALGSYASNNQDYNSFMKDIQYNPDKYHGPNKLDVRNYSWNRSSFDALLNYDKSFSKHNLKTLLGYRVEKFNTKEVGATRTGFPNNDITDMNAGTASTQTNYGFSRELAMMSYFGRIKYDYSGKYLFEANFRADASSRFSSKNRWGYFPSLSAAWRISEESFMENTSSWLQSLKLRTSWGQLGNQDALNSDNSSDYYPWLATYNVGQNYPFDGVVNTGIAQISHKLESISWEKTTTWGIGLDLLILNCLELTLDFYNRKTKDIIMEIPIPGTFGLLPYKENIGAMRNTGFELMIGYKKSWNDWTLNVSGNFSMNRNKILNLGGVDEMISDYYVNRVGKPYRSFYGYQSDGLFKSQNEADEFTAKYGNPFGRKFKAGDIRYKDTNGDGKLNSDDRDIYSAEQPKFTFGLNTSVAWKNIDLSIFMQGALGVSRYFNEEVLGDFNGDTSHPSTAWFDAWSPQNPNGKFPYVSEASSSPSHPSIRSTFWVFKTNYLRFKNIRLGYTLPNKWFSNTGVSRVKVFYSGENLFKIDNLPVNIDPEAPSGRGSHYPQVATNSFGVNVTF